MQVVMDNWDSSQNYQTSTPSGIRRLNKKDSEKVVVAVIVTFCSGSTSDNLFSSTEQKTEEGTQVSVYSAPSACISDLLEAFKTNETSSEVIKCLIEEVKDVDPDCVVFNWECCSGYSG